MKALAPCHDEYTFAPAGRDGAYKELELPLGEPTFFIPAFQMLTPPEPQVLEECLRDGEIQLWRMLDGSGQQKAVVIFSEWTSLATVYVYVAPKGLFEPEICKPALEALIVAIFAADASRQDVMTPVRHPQHDDAELVLATLGFETIGTRKEFEAVSQSYWLRRPIWDAYRSA